jgi:hypothetical protein
MISFDNVNSGKNEIKLRFNNLMKKFKCFLLLSFFLLAQNQAESKTQKVLPKEYIGAWSIGGCDHYEKCGERSDGLMEISPQDIGFYESSCDVQKITKLKNDSLKLETICTGEGSTRKEIFHIQLISSQEIRIVFGGDLPFATATTYIKCAEPSNINCNE